MESSTTSQARSKRETLLSRSKRIIGKQLSTDAKDDDQTDDSASSTPQQNDAAKRRAQILKAQRTHRRRTQNYIQELEKEVLRLRAREAELMREIESLSSNSSSYSRSQSYGIPSPPASTGSAHPTEHHVNQDTPAVTIDLTSYSEMIPEYPCSIQAATIPQPEYSKPSVDIAAYLSNVEINDTGAGADSVCALDTQAAIDFILELERPCLPHVKFDFEMPKPSRFKVPNFNAGYSHACTTSAAIIHSHQHVDFATQKLSIPAQEIERLLESSRSLPLGPEMTPVQVWAILVDISNQQPITTAALSALKEELAKYMHCNAFGTTIEIDTLRQVLNFFFPWYSTSQLHDQHLPQTELAKQRLTTTLGDGWQDYF